MIYLKPEKNVGTIFYKNKKVMGEMKSNGKLIKEFFSREQKSNLGILTGDNKSNRIALVYNLMTKEVSKRYIELKIKIILLEIFF